MALPTLPQLPSLASMTQRVKGQALFSDAGFDGGYGFSDPGTGGGGWPGGGPSIGVDFPPSSGGGGGGGGISSGVLGMAGSALSSVLGIPAINWGRIAAFLLGLLLIAGGLYLIGTGQDAGKAVNVIVKSGIKKASEAAAAP